jgi:hypothetical protein
MYGQRMLYSRVPAFVCNTEYGSLRSQLFLTRQERNRNVSKLTPRNQEAVLRSICKSGTESSQRQEEAEEKGRSQTQEYTDQQCLD